MTVLTDLDVACGITLGAPRRPLRLPRAPGDVLGALEDAIRPALLRGPCLVSFSGGRDSSLVLAAAARLARREGLPDPVPATNVIPDAPSTDERRWQEAVVAHLGLADWVRVEHDDELDVVGPYARRVLRAHGLLWPFNVHFHLPLLDAARGGTLLTGIAGDELFRSASRPVLRGRRAHVLHRLPGAVRRRLMRPAIPGFPWLTQEGGRAVRAASRAHDAYEPRTRRRRMGWVLGQRYLRVGGESLERVAGLAGARVAHPLADPRVWGAVAAAAPRSGYADRTAAMRALFAGLLPDEVLAREDKAGFDAAFWRGPARSAVEAWDGRGLPSHLVDAGALAAHWRGERPMAQSFLLLQAAWLASRMGERGEELGDGRERVGAPRAAQAPDRA